MIKIIGRLNFFSFLFILLMVVMPPFDNKVQSAEMYERKSISIFNPANSPFFPAYKEAFVSLGRFDYYPIAAPKSMDLDGFIQAVIQYGKLNAKKQAQSRTLPDLKFKTIVVTKEDVEKIMNSAYIFFPKWSFGQTYIGPRRTDTDKNKKETTTVTVSCYFVLTTNIYDNHFEEVDTISSTKLLTEDLKKEIKPEDSKQTRKYKEEVFQEEIEKARNTPSSVYFKSIALTWQDAMVVGVIPNHVTQARRLDPFIIKSKIVNYDRPRDVIYMTFGENQGIKMDNGYKIILKEQNKRGQTSKEIGFLKVREILKDKSGLQPIIMDKANESDIGGGDQLIEYPKQGFNLYLKAGVAPLSQMAASVTLGVEQDFAEWMNISEFYGILEGSGYFLFDSFKDSPWIVNIGLMKKFYMRQLGIEIGVKSGIMDSISDPDSKLSLTVNPVVGLEYYMTPDVLWALECEYIIPYLESGYKANLLIGTGFKWSF